MVNKSSEQVLNDCHDDANDALRTIGSGGTPPSPAGISDNFSVTGTAVDKTTAVGDKWRPGHVSAHGNAAITSALTIKFKPASGAEQLLVTFAAGWTDIYFDDFNRNAIYGAGDELHIECANAGAANINGDIRGEDLS